MAYQYNSDQTCSSIDSKFGQCPEVLWACYKIVMFPGRLCYATIYERKFFKLTPKIPAIHL